MSDDNGVELTKPTSGKSKQVLQKAMSKKDMEKQKQKEEEEEAMRSFYTPEALEKILERENKAGKHLQEKKEVIITPKNEQELAFVKEKRDEMREEVKKMQDYYHPAAIERIQVVQEVEVKRKLISKQNTWAPIAAIGEGSMRIAQGSLRAAKSFKAK
eukprot:c1818_g1_i1.p1 GENE.c1818_g1_i1~~c1818_g1_i1.p1  ORF type:complete len:158 (-),score=68.77 c1818_g1_i1:166-639(-)